MRLQKWQRNVIFEAIVEGELNPGECRFEYDDARSRITHVPSGSYFLLEGDPGHYTATSVVGEDVPRAIDAFTWSTVEDRVRQWARVVKADVDTPDLWAELRRERGTLTTGAYEEAENAPFTPEERTEVAEQLREIRELVGREFALTEAQAQRVEAGLRYLEAEASRAGRTEWRILFYGVMLDTIVGGILLPDEVHRILVTAFSALGHLFGGGGGPLPLPPGA